MKRFVSFIVILILLLTSMVIFASLDDSQIPPMDLEYEKALIEQKSNQIIVKFKEDASKKSKKNFAKGYSLKTSNSYDLNKSIKVMDAGDRDIDELIGEIKKDPSVEYAEKDYKNRMFKSLNDTYYDRLWHMDKIDAENAWNQTDFSREIVVAVIDSGIDTNHRDLRNRIASGGYNYFADNTIVYDYEGHGTFVSGVIGAEANNNYGIAGVAGTSNVKILPLKVFNPEGDALNSDIIRAIDYSIEMGVDVINMSLGGDDYSYAFDDACQRAIDANIVVVAAVGNEGDEDNKTNYPAAYDRVIGVGSTDEYDHKASFSNANESVDIVAPGKGLYSTWTRADIGKGGFAYGNGTSYSAPMVAASAALMKGINQDISVGEISNILKSTAKDLGPKGKDMFFGHGLLDMNRAIQEVIIKQTSEEYVDFNILDVDSDKVLKVRFNNPVSLTSINQGIYGSSDSQGGSKDIDISISIDEKNPKIVYISPVDGWLSGYSFVFIGDNVRDIRGRKQKEKVRIVVLNNSGTVAEQ